MCAACKNDDKLQGGKLIFDPYIGGDLPALGVIFAGGITANLFLLRDEFYPVISILMG